MIMPKKCPMCNKLVTDMMWYEATDERMCSECHAKREALRLKEIAEKFNIS